MDWTSVVDDAVKGASAIVGNLTSSPNDQKKAVSAAKSAGKKAQKNAEDLYPSWDVKGTKALAEKEGITTRAEWKRARNKAGQSAYQEAYDRTYEMYEKAKNAEINALEFQSSQEYLDWQLQMAQTNAEAVSSGLALSSKSGASGCLGFASLLVVSGSGLVCLLINLI